MVQTVLLSAFFFVASATLLFAWPTNVVQAFLNPTSFHDQLPRHTSVLICPRLIRLTSQHSLDRLQPYFFFQLRMLVICCPRLPINHPGLVSKACSSRPAGRHHSHVHRHLFPHNCSCKSSHLSPCLYFKHLLHPSLVLLSSPSSQLDTFRAHNRGHGGKFFLNFQDIHFHEK